MTRKDLLTVDGQYNALLQNEFFTEEELNLVIKGWGYNEETLNTICYVRYGMNDVEQLFYEDGLLEKDEEEEEDE